MTFLRGVFGSVALSHDSINAAASCPKCKNTSKKKLAIRLDDDRVHCWVCGLGGRLITLLVQYFPNHVREYLGRFGGKHIVIDVDPSVRDVELPQNYRLLGPEMGSQVNEVRWAVNYLRGRGLSDRDIWYFKFGISDDPQMRGRVIMPSFDAEGKLNFYTGRALDPDAYRKYMNCAADKKSIIFNEINIDWSQELTLVEGPFDLTKCDDNAAPLLGSSLSEDSMLFLRIYQNRTPIVLALDSDMQDKVWQRIARLLDSYDIPVRILPLGQFKDVGEMSRGQFLEAKRAAVKWDSTSALIERVRRL